MTRQYGGVGGQILFRQVTAVPQASKNLLKTLDLPREVLGVLVLNGATLCGLRGVGLLPLALQLGQRPSVVAEATPPARVIEALDLGAQLHTYMFGDELAFEVLHAITLIEAYLPTRRDRFMLSANSYHQAQRQ